MPTKINHQFKLVTLIPKKFFLGKYKTIKAVLAGLAALLTVLSPQVYAGKADELRILASARITPASVVERFEKKYGIRVRFEYFSTHAALASYLETQPKGDLILLRGYYIESLIEKSQVLQLNHELLPNLRHLSQRAMSASADPGRIYSVPYIIGTMGIVYHSGFLGDKQPNWEYVFRYFAGTTPFAVTDQYRDAIGSALMSLNQPYNSDSPAAIGQAADVLRAVAEHPAFIGFLSAENMLQFLTEGFVYVAVTHNDLAARAIQGNPNLAYAASEDNGVAWSYVYVLNCRCGNQSAAYKWLNFLLEPEVAAEISVWNQATSPNQAALALLPPEIRDNRVLYPPDAVWDNAQTPSYVGLNAERLYTDYWSRIK